MEAAHVFGDLAFFVKRQSGDGGEVFAEREGLHEALGGGVELAAAEEEIEGFDVFGDLADRLVGQGVERGDRGGNTERFGKELGDVGVLLDAQRGIAVFPDLVVKSGGHEDVLIATLDEPLDHGNLVLGLGANSLCLGADDVLLFEDLDFVDSAEGLYISQRVHAGTRTLGGVVGSGVLASAAPAGLAAPTGTLRRGAIANPAGVAEGAVAVGAGGPVRLADDLNFLFLDGLV